MSVNGALLSSVSGMNAQATKLGSVADNISNASTTGYKRQSNEFETLVGSQGAADYAGGGVITAVRSYVQEQGTLAQTSSATDLAIDGAGFFIVSDAEGARFLTRSGAFVPDANGNLINTAGYYLLGQDLSRVGSDTGGISTLVKVNVAQTALNALASTKASFGANLPSQAGLVAPANLPSANAATAQFTATNSLVAYDNLGAPVTLDLYFAKTAANTWQVAVFNRANAASGGGFPYASPALATQTLSFDPTSGSMTGATPMSIAIPNGKTLSLDLGGTTQLAAPFSVQQTEMNGKAPSAVDHVEIDQSGTLTTVYGNGARIDLYRISLAKVTSPDRLAAKDGNVFAMSSDSGNLIIGGPQSAGFGGVRSSTLELSTVDLGAELSEMIQTQRAYTANSKVFQASSNILEVLNNLKA